jgi:hypothetical protein
VAAGEIADAVKSRGHATAPIADGAQDVGEDAWSAQNADATDREKSQAYTNLWVGSRMAEPASVNLTTR